MPLRQITAAEYRQIRKWTRRADIVAAVTGIAIALFVAWIKRGGNPQINPNAFITLVWCALALILLPGMLTYWYALAMSWLCPHCGEEFMGRRGRLRTECYHCGVSLDEIDPPMPTA